jgi:hypothetical protein
MVWTLGFLAAGLLSSGAHGQPPSVARVFQIQCTLTKVGSNGKVEVLTNPVLMTQEGQQANLVCGGQQAVTSAPGVVDFIDAGHSLHFKVTGAGAGKVRLDATLQFCEVKPSTKDRLRVATQALRTLETIQLGKRVELAQKGADGSRYTLKMTVTEVPATAAVPAPQPVVAAEPVPAYCPSAPAVEVWNRHYRVPAEPQPPFCPAAPSMVTPPPAALVPSPLGYYQAVPAGSYSGGFAPPELAPSPLGYSQPTATAPPTMDVAAVPPAPLYAVPTVCGTVEPKAAGLPMEQKLDTILERLDRIEKRLKETNRSPATTEATGTFLRAPTAGATPVGLDFGFPVSRSTSEAEQLFKFWVGTFK